MKIRVIDIKENPDGRATMDFEYDEEVKEMVKKLAGRKRASKKLIRDYVLKALEVAVKIQKRKK